MAQDSQLWAPAYARMPKPEVKVHTVRGARKWKPKPERNEPMLNLHRIKKIDEQIKALKDERRRLIKQIPDYSKAKRVGNEYFNQEIYLYVLRLEDDCWYVGSTRNVQKRFQRHLRGKGSNWTRLHKPIEISKTVQTGETDDGTACKMEDELTLEYASMYGTDKVRGGGYCQTKPRWPITLMV